MYTQYNSPDKFALFHLSNMKKEVKIYNSRLYCRGS